MLEHAGIPFTLHTYEYEPTADRIGMQAAEALGAPADQVLKTLLALIHHGPGFIQRIDYDFRLDARPASIAGGNSWARQRRRPWAPCIC